MNPNMNPQISQFPQGEGSGKKGKKKKEKKLNDRQRAILREAQKEQSLRKRYAVRNAQEYYRNIALGGNKRKGDPNSDYRLPEDKKQSKGKDYFFVMRKFVCLLMFLLTIVLVALFALSYLKMLPEYTSLYTAPDYTPEAERIEKEVDGVMVPYEDKSANYGMLDPIFGCLGKFTGLELGESPFYDTIAAKSDVGYANIILQYVGLFFPIAMVLYVITALVLAIKAFLGMFGKRIFRRFGFGAIVLLIFGVITLMGGLAANSAVDAEALDFASLVPILTSGIMTPADLTTAPAFSAGFGLLGMIGIPVVVLILSIFAKKKIPFSIFD